MPPKLPPIPGDDPLESLKNLEFGIGQNAEGGIDAFPLSELPQRRAAQASDYAAWTDAVKQSEAGFPENDDPEFMDDYAALAGAEPPEDEAGE